MRLKENFQKHIKEYLKVKKAKEREVNLLGFGGLRENLLKI